MNAHRIHKLALSQETGEQRKAATETLAYLHTLTTAVLEVAGAMRLAGDDPLSARSRAILSDFVSLGESVTRGIGE